MKTFLKTIFNTNEDAIIDSNTAITPECFIRLTPNLLLGIRNEDIKGETKIQDLSICYVYQKNKEGIYVYVAQIDIRPAETNLELESVRNPMQLTVLANFLAGKKGEIEQLALINENNKENPVIPHRFRYIFGR